MARNPLVRTRRRVWEPRCEAGERGAPGQSGEEHWYCGATGADYSGVVDEMP